MILANAVRAAAQGPSGFSLALISTPPSTCGGCKSCAANIGSVTTPKANAAEAAAVLPRNARRESSFIVLIPHTVKVLNSLLVLRVFVIPEMRRTPNQNQAQYHLH